MKKNTIVISLLISSVLFFNACSHKTVAVQKTTTNTVPFFSLASVAEGEKIYKSSCGTCHELKEPSEYSQHEWVSIMRSMAKKAKLDDVQKDNVTAYVNSLAKK